MGRIFEAFLNKVAAPDDGTISFAEARIAQARRVNSYAQTRQEAGRLGVLLAAHLYTPGPGIERQSDVAALTEHFAADLTLGAAVLGIDAEHPNGESDIVT